MVEVGPGVTKPLLGDKVLVAMAATGTMAEELVVRATAVIPMPSTLSFEQAAGFGVGYMTAYHGYVLIVAILRRNRIKHRGNILKGETLMVTGAAGGMGAAAIQVGKVRLYSDRD